MIAVFASTLMVSLRLKFAETVAVIIGKDRS